MKICLICNNKHPDNADKYCQNCGATLPDVLTNDINNDFDEVENQELNRRKTTPSSNDEKIKRLLIADFLLILLFIPFSYFGVDKFEVLIITFLLVILLMTAITIKYLLTNDSDDSSKQIKRSKNWSSNNNKNTVKNKNNTSKTSGVFNYYRY